MTILWKKIRGLSEDPSDGPFDVEGVKIPNIADANEVTPAAAFNGLIWYDSTNHVFQGVANGAEVTLRTAAAAGDNTLDAAYDEGGAGAGRAIDVDSGAVQFIVSDTDNNGVLELTQNDTTNNPDVLTFSNAGTGADITADNWSVSKAGLITCTDIACSGSIAYAGATITGSVAFGADGTGHDVYIYSDTAGDWVFFDDTNKVAQFVDYKIQMMDDDEIHWGAGAGAGTGDYDMSCDGTHLYLRANAAVASQAFKIGGNTNTVDIEWLGTTAGAEVLFDASGDRVIFDGIDLRMNDDDIIEFGDNADMTITFTSPDIVIAAVNAAGVVKILSADTGALGAQLTLEHNPTSQAASDVVGRILFVGEDVSQADNSYGQIDVVAVASTDGSERGRMDFYAGDPTAGGLVIGLTLDNDGTNALATVGDGAAASFLQGSGAFDLSLRVNSGTNSGIITLASGANANITITPNGTGRVAITGPALANGTAHNAVPQIVCMPYVPASFDANNDLALMASSPKMKVIDAWLDNDVAEGGAMTLTIRDAASGAGNIIAAAMDMNATTILHTATLTTEEIAATSTVYANANGNPGTAEGTIYMMYIEVA